MSRNFDYDLFVIGGGSGGVRVARWSGGLGAKVAICEEDQFGGTCVVRGCIPKKFMVLASHLPDEIESMKNYGWTVGEASFDWSTLKENRDKEINRLSGLYKDMLLKNGVTILSGRGKILDPHTVEVEGKAYSAKYVVVAVGGRAFVPELPGREHVMTSKEIFNLSEQPKEVLIVGGGYIAVEFAGIFNGLGTKTSLLFRTDPILRGFDENVRFFLQEEISKKGIKLWGGNEVKKVEKKDSKLLVTLESGDEVFTEAVLCATGRVPYTEGLGLEAAGVKRGEKGEIAVDEFHRTNVESIYAIGDCTDRINLTPVATAEGTFLAENLFNQKNFRMTYDKVPSAVFSQPPVATVGLSEAAAKQEHGSIDVYESNFRGLKHTISGMDERTYMKVIVESTTQKVIGIHMVGADAPEIMQGLAVAVKAGATKKDFDATIGIHPTAAEEFTTMRTKRSSK